MSIFTKIGDALGGFGTKIVSGLMGSGLDMLANQMSFGQSKKLMDYQYQLQQQAIDKMNQYNSPVQQIERLKAAGLSPNLVYGSGVDGNQSSAASPGIANRSMNISNPLQDAAQQYTAEKQLELEKIRARNEAFESKERQLNLRARTLGQLLDNEFNTKTLRTRVQREAQALVNDMERGDLLAQQTNNAVIQAGVIKMQADVLAAKEHLTREQATTEAVKRELYRSNIRANDAQCKQIAAMIPYIEAGTDLRTQEHGQKELEFEATDELNKWLADHPNVELTIDIAREILGSIGGVKSGRHRTRGRRKK